MPEKPIPPNNPPDKYVSPGDARKKTYFGIAALIMGILCVLSLLANYNVANLNIPQETFNRLNNLTALSYCVLTEVTIVLGLFGHTRKNDLKNLSRTGIVLALIPFLFVFGQFLFSFLK